jgi:hypothetical protein
VARPGAGLSGAALFVGIGGLYLAYAGIRDVPLVDGLRSLLRGETPAGAKAAPDWAPITMAQVAAQEGDGTPPASGQLTGDSGIAGLKGAAALAYPVLKAAFPHLRMGGWRPSGSVPNSDHPKGLAIDVMTGDDAMAQRVIGVARRTPKLRNWIWNRHYASVNTGWRKTPCGGSCGPSPHTDHVHLSWSA